VGLTEETAILAETVALMARGYEVEVMAILGLVDTLVLREESAERDTSAVKRAQVVSLEVREDMLERADMKVD